MPAPDETGPVQPALMLDTNVFNHVLDGRIRAELLTGARLLVIKVQAAELGATRNEARRAALLATLAALEPVPVLASSFLFGVDGAGWDQAEWNDGSGRFEAMLARLQEIDGKRPKALVNQLSDIAIGETAIVRGATLVSSDAKFRQVVEEFGGRAITPDELPLPPDPEALATG